MNKKLLFVLIGTGFIVLIIVLIFLLVQDKKEKEKISQLTEKNESNEIQFAHLSKNGQTLLFFDALKTNFFKIKIGQKESEPLTNHNFITVKKVVWSNADSQVLIKVLNHRYPFRDKISPVSNENLPENTQLWWLYDFETQKSTLLRNEKVSEAIFSPDGSQISYSLQNGDNTYSIFVVETGNVNDNAKKILETDSGNPIDWSSDNKYLLVKGIENDSPVLSIIDLSNNRVMAKVSKGESGKFSPDGKIIAYDYSEDFEQREPAIYFLENGKNEKINLETTMEKITWLDNNKLIAVVPEKDENFYMFDLVKNKIKLFYSAKRTINVLSLMIAPDKKTLFFISNGAIFKLQLPK